MKFTKLLNLLLESPDEIRNGGRADWDDPGNVTLSFLDDTIIYTQTRAVTHDNLALALAYNMDENEKDDELVVVEWVGHFPQKLDPKDANREDFDYNGRLFRKIQVISFWEDMHLNESKLTLLWEFFKRIGEDPDEYMFEIGDLDMMRRDEFTDIVLGEDSTANSLKAQAHTMNLSPRWKAAIRNL